MDYLAEFLLILAFLFALLNEKLSICLVILCLFLFRFYLFRCRISSNRLDKKVVIVTGSSDGIGKTAALEFLDRGAEVVFACRNKEKTEKVLSELPKTNLSRAIFINLDLASFKSVENFCAEFKKKFDRLDILLNNAGLHSNSFKPTEDGLENTIQCNYFGHVLLTDRLYPLLERSEGRIVNVSSLAHAFLKFESEMLRNPVGWWRDGFANSYQVYGLSKALNVMFTIYMEKINKANSTGVTAYSLDPGVVRTNIFSTLPKWLFLLAALLWIPLLIISKSPVEGALSSIYCCTEEKSKLISGKFYFERFPLRVRKFVEINVEEAMDYTRTILGKKGYSINL